MSILATTIRRMPATGVALVNGDGVAMDRREGVDWLQRAAVQGKPEAIADLETLARAGIIIMEGIEP